MLACYRPVLGKHSNKGIQLFSLIELLCKTSQELRMTYESPCHSWNLMGPSVVFALKFGMVVPSLILLCLLIDVKYL
jgi:hypothetical protein